MSKIFFYIDITFYLNLISFSVFYKYSIKQSNQNLKLAYAINKF